jgi:hypothetical protein
LFWHDAQLSAIQWQEWAIDAVGAGAVSCLQFPATACEDSSSASLIVRNTSSDCSSVFEFGVPTGSHIKVGWDTVQVLLWVVLLQLCVGWPGTWKSCFCGNGINWYLPSVALAPTSQAFQ